MKKVAVREIQQ